LLTATILLYIPWLFALINAPSWSEPGSGSGESRYSEGWAVLIVLLLGTPLWLLLGWLILLAGRKGFAPAAWVLASRILYLFAVCATFGAARTYLTWPGGLSILVPALLPPLLAFYAISVRLPSVATGPMRMASALALATSALVSFAAIPFATIDPLGYPARLAQERHRWDAVFEARDAEALKKAQQWEADIEKLGPNSSLAAWLEYVNGSIGSAPLHQRALEGARRATSRQTEVVMLLENGQINQLAELWQFDISATPALCRSYDHALNKLAASDEPFEAKVGEHIERQLPNLQYLIAKHCDLASALWAAEARTRKVAAVNPAIDRWGKVLAALAALRQGS